MHKLCERGPRASGCAWHGSSELSVAAADSRGGYSTAGWGWRVEKSLCLGTPAQLAGDTPCLLLGLSPGCQPALNTLSLPSSYGFRAGKWLCWGQALIPGNGCTGACETLALLESKSSCLKAQYIKSGLVAIEIFWLCLSLGAFHSSELLLGLGTAQLQNLLGKCFSREHLEVGSCCLF